MTHKQHQSQPYPPVRAAISWLRGEHLGFYYLGWENNPKIIDFICFFHDNFYPFSNTMFPFNHFLLCVKQVLSSGLGKLNQVLPGRNRQSWRVWGSLNSCNYQSTMGTTKEEWESIVNNARRKWLTMTQDVNQNFNILVLFKHCMFFSVKFKPVPNLQTSRICGGNIGNFWTTQSGDWFSYLYLACDSLCIIVAASSIWLKGSIIIKMLTVYF